MKAEIGKIRKAVETIASQTNLDGKFRKSLKRYEIKLKIELNSLITNYLDLLGPSIQKMELKSGHYEDKCFFYRLLGDFCRYGLLVGTDKLSFSE